MNKVEEYLNKRFSEKDINRTICNHALYLQKEQIRELIQSKMPKDDARSEYEYHEDQAKIKVLKELLAEL